MSERRWSVSRADVLSSVREVLAADRSAVLATVVDVEGSAYRRPGARMIVEAGGDGLGHVTAGCLEDEVRALAGEVLETDEPRLETYDLTNDGDDVWGLGIGCNGVIDVLLEPVDERHRPLTRAFAATEPICVVTVLEGAVPRGETAYASDGADGVEVVPETDGFPAWLGSALSGPAATLLEEGGADTVTVETERGTVAAFVEGIHPAPEMVVFGSGHDVGPVVDLAAKNGFRVTVVGYRGAVDLRERFPHADDRVATAPGRLEDELDLDGNTYAVVMTHNFVDDRLTVERLLEASVPYVGVMGPRKRFEEMLEELEVNGRPPSEIDLSPVYTPVGLNLGDGSPYGIATSIVAEALAVHNDREPAHLADREGPIHERVDLAVDASTTD